jgi:hypothetical protein
MRAYYAPTFPVMPHELDEVGREGDLEVGIEEADK